MISEGNNASYAHSVLEEEFFKFVITVMEDDDDTPKFTEDRLVHCDFEEGDIVLFQAGKAVVEDKKAYATVPLCGKFIIRRNSKGKLVASQKLQDVVKVPEISDDSLIFVTKPGGGKDAYTCKHLADITKAMMDKEATITLVPYIKGQDIHDAIVVDNTVIGSFRCSFAVGGKAINSDIVTKMYLYKQGTVKNIIISDQGGSVGQVAIVVLENVKTVPAPDIKENKILEDQKKMFAAAQSNFILDQNKFPFFSFGTVTTESVKAFQPVKETEKEPEIEVTPKKVEEPDILKAMFGKMFVF